MTTGEALFEKYLADRGIAFDEPAIGKRRPDYCLRTEPLIFCEVKDFTEGPEDKAEFEAFAKGEKFITKGPDEMYRRLRSRIAKAAKQLRERKPSPCVVVLYNDASTLSLEPFFIAGAMFGDPAILQPLNGSEPTSIFTKNRMTARDKNTTVSAVAVLSQTNAGRHLIDEVTAKAPPSAQRSDLTRQFAKAIIDLGEKAPEAFDRVPYLMVHHNPFSATPLPVQLFDGPLDQHFRY